MKTAWSNKLSLERDRTVKYLTLLRRFKKSPKLLSKENIQWILDNMDVETDIVPLDFLKENNLFM